MPRAIIDEAVASPGHEGQCRQGPPSLSRYGPGLAPELQGMMMATMKRQQSEQRDSDLPSGLGKPAHRALAGAGYVRLEQFTQVSEAEVLELHGMGPKALGVLRQALEARGLSFAGGKTRSS